MPPKRVLIVDDSKDAVGFLRDALKYLDPTLWVTVVQSAEDALLEMIHHSADLLVVDVHLPGISGLELVKKIRAGNRNAKIILISGLVDADLRERSRESGADVFIRKPVELGEFLSTVDGLMGLGKNLASLEKPVFEKPAERPAIEPAIHEKPVEAPLPPMRKASDERLPQLRQRLSAEAVLLVEANGRVLAQVGALPEVFASPEWLAEAFASLRAAQKASQSLGSADGQNVLTVRGGAYNLVAMLAGNDRGLFVILAPSAGMVRLAVALEELFYLSGETNQPEAANAPSVQLPVARAATPFPPATPIADPEPATRPAPAAARPPLAPVEEAPVEQADELEKLFKQVKPGLSSSQMDAFWDHLAEEKGKTAAADTETLTYDQAVSMGLAPKDHQS